MTVRLAKEVFHTCSPGAVSTDMGHSAFSNFGMNITEYPGAITPQQSGEACVKMLDQAYETKVSPEFRSWSGKTLPW